MNMLLTVDVLTARPWDNASEWTCSGDKGRKSWWRVWRDGHMFNVCVEHARDETLTFVVWTKDRSRAVSFESREDAEKAMHAHIACTDDMPCWEVIVFDMYADKERKEKTFLFWRESEAGAYARKRMAVGHVERVKATVREISAIKYAATYAIS
jgi:hypothetical protein